MLCLSEYFRAPLGDINPTHIENANDLLHRINGLLSDLNWEEDLEISSGYRTAKANARAGGKPKSYHLVGRAVDIVDLHKHLYLAIIAHYSSLEKYSLWMEDGNFTNDWVHLDTGTRSARTVRTFKP